MLIFFYQIYYTTFFDFIEDVYIISMGRQAIDQARFCPPKNQQKPDPCPKKLITFQQNQQHAIDSMRLICYNISRKMLK